MARLHVRCRSKPRGCFGRDTIPDTSKNRHKLEHRDIKCKQCGEWVSLLPSRKTELAKRRRCSCDGVEWADLRNSPHDTNTAGCKHYEDRKIDASLKSHRPVDIDSEPTW